MAHPGVARGTAAKQGGPKRSSGSSGKKDGYIQWIGHRSLPNLSPEDATRCRIHGQTEERTGEEHNQGVLRKWRVKAVDAGGVIKAVDRGVWLTILQHRIAVEQMPRSKDVNYCFGRGMN